MSCIVSTEVGLSGIIERAILVYGNGQLVLLTKKGCL